MENIYVALVDYLFGVIAGGTIVGLVGAWRRIGRMSRAHLAGTMSSTMPPVMSPLMPMPMPMPPMVQLPSMMPARPGPPSPMSIPSYPRFYC